MTSQATKRRRTIDEDEPMDFEGDVFTEKDQIFLNFIMQSKMIPTETMETVHKKIFKNSVNLDDTLSKLIKKLNTLQMDIKQVKCDRSGQPYYVMFHTAGESHFVTCSSLKSRNEVYYLKGILSDLMCAEDGMLKRIQLINGCKFLSKVEAEESLNSFLKQKILMEDNRGVIWFSPLAVTEFEPFFKAVFKNVIYPCKLCKQLVFVSLSCPECKTKFHRYCAIKWKKNSSKCPECNHDWDDDDH